MQGGTRAGNDVQEPERLWKNWELVHRGVKVSDACGWLLSDLDLREEPDLVATLNLSLAEPIVAETSWIMRRELAFYGGDTRSVRLYEIFDAGRDDDAVPTRMRLLRVLQPGEPDDIVLLNWTSRVLHQKNAEWKLDLNARPDQVISYLEYFCNSLAGEDGTFAVVGPVASPAHDAEAGSFECEVVIQYGLTVFRGQMRVSGSGEVVMLSDEPAEDSDSTPEHRWIAGTKRLVPVFRDSMEISPDEFLQCLVTAEPGEALWQRLKARWRPVFDKLIVAGPVRIDEAVSEQPDFEFKSNWNVGKLVPRGRMRIEKVHVRGDVDLSGGTFAKGLSFENWTIDGKLNLAGASINQSLRLEAADIGQNPSESLLHESPVACLDLTGATVSGGFEVLGSKVTGATLPRSDTRAAIALRQAHITGDVRLEKVTVTGDIDGSGVRFDGEVSI